MILSDITIYGCTNSLPQHHLIQDLHYIINAIDYWPLAREYSIWNVEVSTLQFWTADLEPNILSNAIEQVYTAFFYTISTHLLCNQPEEDLFGHFVTTLNDAFERELALADEGYETGSETSNLPTPLRRTSRIHHISSDENISFDPSTPCTPLPASQIKSLYTAVYLLAVLMPKTTASHYH